VMIPSKNKNRMMKTLYVFNPSSQNVTWNDFHKVVSESTGANEWINKAPKTTPAPRESNTRRVIRTITIAKIGGKIENIVPDIVNLLLLMGVVTEYE
jgi:hypothetical protein